MDKDHNGQPGLGSVRACTRVPALFVGLRVMGQ